MIEPTSYIELIEYIIKCIVIGFFAVPLFQTISLCAIQVAFIKKHKLKSDGIKKSIIVILIATYLSFLTHKNTRPISGKLKNGEGGFRWAGTFKWKIW
jgi:H+/Cl- antiporter ClcA